MDEHKKAVIQRWLVKASHDPITAKVMLKNDPSVTDTICFHAQQRVEKALKAFLAFADIHVEKTHYLPRLVEISATADNSFHELDQIARELTDYAVEVRYIDDWREISLEEAVEAVEKAKKAMAFIRARMSGYDSHIPGLDELGI
jgi:HEPN domain-containing protein